MSGLSFTEELTGWLSFEETDFNQALLAGQQARRTAKVHLNIVIADLEAFMANPSHRATATGWVDCGELGGRLPVTKGWFDLFVETPDLFRLRMRYRLFLRTATGRELTLIGFKLVENDLRTDHWADVTTLFVRVYEGSIAVEPPPDERVPGLIGTGILRVGVLAFIRQLTTYRGTALNRLARWGEIARFQAFFMSKLTLAYAGAPVNGIPSFPRDGPPPAENWEPVVGRPDLERLVVLHITDDGLTLPLENVRRVGGGGEAPLGPVLIAHGAGIRGRTFYGQTTGRTVADALLDEGYDVWAENWRGSSDLPTYPWTLEQVARFDHPSAVRTVLDRTGAATLKAVVHCQGSVSFTMAAVAGLLPQVTHVVCTGVALHIRVPLEAREKQGTMLSMATRLTPWIDAQWAIRPITPPGRGLAVLGAMTPRQQRVVRVFMKQVAALDAARGNPAPIPPGQVDDETEPPGFRGEEVPEHPVCLMANFMYGGGANVLWRAVNVPREVNDWMGRELGSSPLTLFNQIAASTQRGHVAPTLRLKDPSGNDMPDSYVSGKPRTDARFTFIGGDRNRMFLPSGLKETYDHFRRYAPAGYHRLIPVKDFGHLDVYFGRDAATVVFPSIIEGLRRDQPPPGPPPADPDAPGSDGDDAAE